MTDDVSQESGQSIQRSLSDRQVSNMRQTEFSQETADEICELIAEGHSLRKICDRDDMPAKSTVFKWLAQQPSFADQYAHAREAQADTLFDDVLAIADQYDSAADKLEVDHINRAKLRIDARKWMAGKLRPKKYGEKLELEHGGQVALVPVINLNANTS